MTSGDCSRTSSTTSGPLLRRRRLALLAYLEAATLLAYVLTHMLDADLAGYIAAVAGGLVLGPTLAILMGHALIRTSGPG